MKKGASQEAAEMMLNSLSPKTIQQYSKPIKLWWEFCQRNNLDIFCDSTPAALQFFTETARTTRSYSTLNVYRSAVSLLMDNKIGKDPSITRFFKGVHTTKPSQSRYDATWDPQLVLQYLSTLYPNDTLTLEKLTMKLTTLLSLITAQRIQTLKAIRLENINLEREPIQIKITDRLKTTGRTRYQPLLEIPSFENQPELCAAGVLRTYIQKTEKIRKGDKTKGYLLLTYKKPHQAATTASISRWIKDTLNKSGINTDIFTAYSTRHASTSAAARRGINIEIIRKAAGWTANSSVFGRFYNRPLIQSESFAAAVIQN
ncbi:uncharacterized protein LOC127290347 [Leptopilina boulardi]|uniref:uncharacterized protein LOC127290347 n=1 Tax=Leptopilina boulardi TaxID=63433 RepID=UPI0021F69A9C|nr:uncharacterized protein LOC127290347 [Leptopilina boulardi]